MLIKNMEKETHKKLLEYIINKSNLFSLSIYSDQHLKKHRKRMNIIVSNSNYSKEKILSEYSNELKDEIYEQFKDNKKIFNQEYVNWFEKDSVIDKYYNRKSAIYSAIDSFVYENRTKRFLKKYKNNIVKDNETVFGEPIDDFIPLCVTDYIFELNEEMIKVINEKDLIDWKYPNSLENLCFIKDNYYIFSSISHEDDYNIYCDNEEEYEYLKSIGVEFYEDHFVKEDKTFWTVS